VSLNRAFPIVNSDGTMSDAFALWTQEGDLARPLRYAGNPDGNVQARQYQFCINTSGTTGSLLYIKMLPDVGGNKLLGWVAV